MSVRWKKRSIALVTTMLVPFVVGKDVVVLAEVIADTTATSEATTETTPSDDQEMTSTQTTEASSQTTNTETTSTTETVPETTTTESTETVSTTEASTEESNEATQESTTTESTTESTDTTASTEASTEEATEESTEDVQQPRTNYSIDEIVNSAPAGMRIQNILQTPSVSKDGFQNKAEVVTNEATNTDVVFITKDQANQLGILWSDKNYKMDVTKDFEIDMKMYFGDEGDNASDGMTFTIHNPGDDPAAYDENGQTIVSGSAGGSLGVMGRSEKGSDKPWQMAVPNSFSIEFDTHVNEGGLDRGIYGNNKKNGFHIANYYPAEKSSFETGWNKAPALYHDGPIYYKKGSSPSDGQWHDFSVRYTADNQQLNYQFDGNAQSTTLDLDKLNLESAENNSLVYWGFTGATGSQSSPQALVFTHITDFGNETTKVAATTQSANVLLGAQADQIDAKDFVKSVEFGGETLKPEDYFATFEDAPSTNRLGEAQAQVKVTLKNNTTKTAVADTTANVVWGDSLVALTDDEKQTRASISLLPDGEAPYLIATQGNGWSQEPLASEIAVNVYRNQHAQPLLTVNGAATDTPEALAQTLNQQFQAMPSRYGDVLGFQTSQKGNNQQGSNTWVSRDNQLVKEATGFDEALYELTPKGYQLLQVNHLTAQQQVEVPLGIKEAELIKQLLPVPEDLQDQGFTLTYHKTKGAIVGPQTGIITVTQPLATGGTFAYDYPVSYTISSQIKEQAVEQNNPENVLQATSTTDFAYADAFTPQPEKYLEKAGELYRYVGYDDGETFHKGLPEPVSQGAFEYTYQYELADQYIDITLPVEMVFGTYDHTQAIESKQYTIQNNSPDMATQVILEDFVKVQSDVTLLGPDDPEPTKETKSAKLNLLVNEQLAIPGMNEDTAEQAIGVVQPQGELQLALNGQYFGPKTETQLVNYQTKLKFKATVDH